MAVPLIKTKLQLPPLRSRTVERPRLRKLLDRAWDAKVTVLSAPAGFGKTTLLVEWLERSTQAGRAIAWLSLDQGDSEPTMFWPHVVAALQQAMASIDGDFPDLPGATMPDDTFVAILINHLASIETPILLVLDDFHFIENADVHTRLGALIEHLPGHVHVVVSTRSDPALPLPRLRSRGELVELRAADLRMSTGETTAYLNEVMGLALSATDRTILEERTEGWIAALQLAVISLHGRTDPTAFIAKFAGTGRYIVDYLVEEVLQRISPELRHFLFSTCILRQFNASLCDAITGHPGTGRALLDQMEKQNLFLVPLDDHRQWYRYHHLFVDVLLAHMPAERQHEMPGLHRKASEWLEANGERSEAIHHATSSGDFAWAADLLERAIPSMRRHRQEKLFRAWMEPIPDEVVRARPVLTVAYVGVMVSLGHFTDAEDRLREAELRLSEVANADAVMAHIELYRTALAQVGGDMPAAARHASRVLELAPSKDHLARAGAAGFLGIASWSSGALDQAVAFWRECRSGLWSQGHVADVQGASIALSDILMAQGHLGEAIEVCEEALALGSDRGRVVARGVADIHTSLCMLHLARDDLRAARDHLDRSLDLGDAFGLPQFPYRSRLAEAQLCVAEGKLLEALAPLQEAKRRYVGDFFPNVRPVPAIAARLQLRIGRHAQANDWVRSADVTPQDTLTYLREFEHITLARVLLARGDAEEALSFLERLADAAIKGGRLASVIEIKVLTALAYRENGHMRMALATLCEATDLAAPERQSSVFNEEGAPLRELLALVPRPRTDSFLRTLLAHTFDEPPGAAPAADYGLIEPLSQREMDVLRLLRSDLSGPEVARQLSVSINTLRTHTKNIFEKLGVNSRRAAVRRADELKLPKR